MNKIWISIFIVLLKQTASQVYIDTSRLTKRFQPLHYELSLEPNFEQRNFKGTLDLQFTAPYTAVETEGDLSTIELNSAGLTVNDYDVSLKLLNGSAVSVVSTAQVDEYEKFIIRPASPLVYDAIYILHLVFEGSLLSPKDMGGLIISSYKNEDGTESPYVIANFFPVFARRAFPCFDEPYFKATFNLSLGVPEGYSSVSSMPLSFTQDGTGIQWHIFKETPIMAPSSLGFMISKLTVAQNTTTNINIWAPTTEVAMSLAQQKWWNFVLLSAETILTFSSTFILPEFNYVFVPDLFTETFANWGIVYVRANIPLYNLKLSNNNLKNFKNLNDLRIIIAKGIGSQYYGDTVSPVWWNEAWLREGISEFEGTFLVTRFEGEIEFKKFMAGYVRPAVLEYQSKYGDAIIQKDVEQNSIQLAQNITRQKSKKGAAVLFMLMNAFSEGVFRPALFDFLSHGNLTTATSKDLFELWQNELVNETLPYNLTVEKIINPWLYTEGVPVVTVVRRQESGNQTLMVSQQKLDSNTAQMTVLEHNSFDYEWCIPLTFTTKLQKEFVSTKSQFWLCPHEARNQTHYTLTIENAVQQSDWVIFNIKGAGLYRVHYDNYNWKLIADQLKENFTIIDELNRAQIVDDTFALAWDGILSYSATLYIAEYLRYETKFYPWYAAFNAFKKLNARISQQGIANDVTNYLKPLVENIYYYVGFYGEEDETFSQIMLRAETLKWACDLQVGDCVDRASAEMQAILANNLTGQIKGDYLEAIFCGGIKNASIDTWTQVYKLYRQKNDTINEKYLLHALGCSKDKNIIESYSKFIITPGELNNSEEALIIFHTITRRLEHTSIALSLLTNQSEAIQQMYGSRILTHMIYSLGDYLTTQSDYDQLSVLKSQSVISDNAVSTAVNATLNTVESSMKWLNTFVPQLQLYFSETTGSPTAVTVTTASTSSISTTRSASTTSGTITTIGSTTSVTPTPKPSSSTYLVHSFYIITISLICVVNF